MNKLSNFLCIAASLAILALSFNVQYTDTQQNTNTAPALELSDPAVVTPPIASPPIATLASEKYDYISTAGTSTSSAIGTASPGSTAPQGIDQSEYTIIKAAAKRNGCTDEKLFSILLAVRKAENGKPGLEFGVMHPRAKNTNLDTQAGWAAATVVKNYERWQAAGSPGDFIDFLGARYAPVGAANDPNGLNRHWTKNVRYWRDKFMSR
jgi:hypothetical protein